MGKQTNYKDMVPTKESTPTDKDWQDTSNSQRAEKPNIRSEAEDSAWEILNEWNYMGHGEWAPPEDKPPGGDIKVMGREPSWIYKWRCTTDKDMDLHQKVCEQGYPNRWEARLPVDTKWNLELFKQLLVDYEDIEVVEWIKYGWPTGRLPSLKEPKITWKNHKGATEQIHNQRANP